MGGEDGEEMEVERVDGRNISIRHTIVPRESNKEIINERTRKERLCLWRAVGTTFTCTIDIARTHACLTIP